MLDNILYLSLYAMLLYAFAVVFTPKNDDVKLFEEPEEVDADFPHCENNEDCGCRNQ